MKRLGLVMLLTAGGLPGMAAGIVLDGPWYTGSNNGTPALTSAAAGIE